MNLGIFMAELQIIAGAYALGGLTAAGYVAIGFGVFTYFIAWYRG
jgi:hypothetical protein